VISPQLPSAGSQPELTGRPAYHPTSLLKIYIYGYLNRIQSSRRLEGVPLGRSGNSPSLPDVLKADV